MMRPPQTCEDRVKITHCKLTMNGNSPGRAFSPPTILVERSILGAANAAPISAKITTNFILLYFTDTQTETKIEIYLARSFILFGNYLIAQALKLDYLSMLSIETVKPIELLGRTFTGLLPSLHHSESRHI